MTCISPVDRPWLLSASDRGCRWFTALPGTQRARPVSDLAICRSVGWILSGRFGKAPRASRSPPPAQSSAAVPEVTLKRPAQVLRRPCRLEPRAGPCDALVGETHTKGGGPARVDARLGGAERRRPARAVAAGRSCWAACTGPARAGRGAAAGGGGRDADGVGGRNPLPGGAAGLGAGGRAHARVPAAQRPVPVEP